MIDSQSNTNDLNKASLSEDILAEHRKVSSDHWKALDAYRMLQPYEGTDDPEPRRKVTRYDILNILSFTDLAKALDIAKDDCLNSSCERHDTSCPTRKVFSSIHIFTANGLKANSIRFPNDPQRLGSWVILAYDGRPFPSGSDIVSLVTTMSSDSFVTECWDNRFHYGDELTLYVTNKYSLDSSVQKSVSVLLGRLDIKEIDCHSIKQWHARKGWSQVAFPSASSPLWQSNEMGEDSGDHWAGFGIDGIPYIGPPHDIFEIKNIEGHVIQVIWLWKSTWGEPLLLSFTLWEKDVYPYTQKWFFLRPSDKIKLCPYGLDMALELSDARVVVGDDVIGARNINHKFSKLMNPRDVIVAWPRQLYGALPDKIDWSGLKGREIVCAVEKDDDSFRHAISLYKQLYSAEAKSIKFMLQGILPDGQKKIEIACDLGRIIGDEIPFEKLIELSKLRGIFTGDDEKSESSFWGMPDDPRDIGAEEFVFDPMIPEGSVSILYANAGDGKSWLALLIGYAVSGGIHIVNKDWFAPTPRKVLYISCELQKKFVARVHDINKAYNCNISMKNFRPYPRTGDKPTTLKIDADVFWKETERLFSNADLIIFDHLKGLMSKNKIDEPSWNELWNERIEPLKRLGKTIIILHHANDKGDFMGSRALAIQIDFKILMEKTNDFGNSRLITFEKQRDDVFLGENLKPVRLYYRLNKESGIKEWWTEDANVDEQLPFKEPPAIVNSTMRAINHEYIEATFKGAEAAIVKIMAGKGCADTFGVKLKELVTGVSQCNVINGDTISDQTVINYRKNLIDKHIVVKLGRASYGLSDDTKEKVFHP